MEPESVTIGPDAEPATITFTDTTTTLTFNNVYAPDQGVDPEPLSVTVDQPNAVDAVEALALEALEALQGNSAPRATPLDGGNSPPTKPTGQN